MAESDSPRFGLRRWSAGTDTPSRVEFDQGHANIDDLGAIDKQGTFAARPAAAIRGTYYWDTTNEYLWRDNGSGWRVIGANTQESTSTASAIGVVPLKALGIAGQTANLFEAKVDGTDKLTVTKDGLVTAASGFVGTHLSLTNATIGTRVIDAIAASGQTADVLRLRNFATTDLFKVAASGEVSGVYLNAGAAKALLGASAYSTAANMTKFSGTPALEVYAATGAAASAFNDFIYLRHQAADATAVTRRLGVLMKVGDEAAGDAGRIGAIYIESSAANFANPKLVLHRADADVMTFDSTPLATIVPPLNVTGRITSTPGSDFGFIVGSAGLYAQSTHAALKTGSGSGFYFYQNSTYSATPGDAGSGSLIGTLDSGGQLITARKTATSTADATLAQSSPAVMIGASGSANLILSVAKVQARNNGAAAELSLNLAGGNVTIGASAATVNITSGALFKIAGRRLTISDSAPSSPSTGDVWIDT